ncbi:MAG TPA: cysteine desulfurase [Longimicrobium sp.]|jgi:cysteine desulfurase/selenocysteine lyase
MSVSTLPAAATPLDVERIRADFPILDQEVNGKRLVYLDNAASTQKPRQVIEAVDRFYRRDNANVHRGVHELSHRATEAYEQARGKVARLMGIADEGELVWTRGTTEALNLIAYSWGLENVRAGDEILLSVLEHHSNLVPWQILAQRTGARLRFLDIDGQGRLDLAQVDDLLTERTKLVSVSHVSNALGTVNPVSEIAARAHAAGALMVVDGAQSAPHLPVDVPSLGADFYAFSGHKMCGPTGIGGLWGRRALLEAMPPFHGGGDMIDVVELERSTYAPLPMKFEAGTPHIAGAVGLGAAADYLGAVGRDAVMAHERHLMAYALERLAEVPDLAVHGPRDVAERSGVVSFSLADVHPHDIATILDQEGVAVRAGHHCCQPLMRRMCLPATARASFYLYTGADDVDRLVEGLHRARALFGY